MLIVRIFQGKKSTLCPAYISWEQACLKVMPFEPIRNLIDLRVSKETKQGGYSQLRKSEQKHGCVALKYKFRKYALVSTHAE